MATYAVGDVQGCHRELVTLLDFIDFRRGQDKLWLCGDLVNRGPESMAVLETVMALGDDAVTVLGNHDLHLLAVALTADRQPKRRDTLDAILADPTREQRLDWLRHRPLMHVDETLGVAMVHAGLPPQWTLQDAQKHASEVESVLRDKAAALTFLENMYGDGPAGWDDGLTGTDRLRFIVNCFTRLRYCTADGRLDLQEKGGSSSGRPDLLPWFSLRTRRSRQTRIVFGHWSTLRLSSESSRRHAVYPLDTGAVWGDRLTALRLEDYQRFSVSSSIALAHD